MCRAEQTRELGRPALLEQPFDQAPSGIRLTVLNALASPGPDSPAPIVVASARATGAVVGAVPARVGAAGGVVAAGLPAGALAVFAAFSGWPPPAAAASSSAWPGWLGTDGVFEVESVPECRS